MRCSYEGCREEATHWLIQPDGRRNPGGWVCESHGREIVEEYRSKLREDWGLWILEVGDDKD